MFVRFSFHTCVKRRKPTASQLSSCRERKEVLCSLSFFLLFPALSVSQTLFIFFLLLCVVRFYFVFVETQQIRVSVSVCESSKVSPSQSGER